MKQSEFGQALLGALAAEGQTQTWLSTASGITQPALNYLINRAVRPRRENLAPICQAFAREDGLDVLCGHLRDEIAAAGYRRTEIVLSTHPAETDGKLDRALDELRAIAGQRRDVAQLLFDLASLCEELPSHHELAEQHQERLLAADPAGPGELAPAPGKPIKYPCTKSAKKAKD